MQPRHNRLRWKAWSRHANWTNYRTCACHDSYTSWMSVSTRANFSKDVLNTLRIAVTRVRFSWKMQASNSARMTLITFWIEWIGKDRRHRRRTLISCMLKSPSMPVNQFIVKLRMRVGISITPNKSISLPNKYWTKFLKNSEHFSVPGIPFAKMRSRALWKISPGDRFCFTTW